MGTVKLDPPINEPDDQSALFLFVFGIFSPQANVSASFSHFKGTKYIAG